MSTLEDQAMLKALLEKYKKIMMCNLLKKEAKESDFSEMRNVAKKLKKHGVYDFATESSNEELFKSITEFTKIRL